jgi:hypothetical protein
MKLNDFLESNGVIIERTYCDTTYKNIENILGKEVWICDYRCGDDIFKKPIRSISPKKVKIFDTSDTNKRIYYSPIFFKEVKEDKVLNTVIAPCDNTGYRGRSGVSVNIFKTESECQRCYEKQLQDAKEQYDSEFAKIKKLYDDKIDWIMKELKG